MSRKKDKVPDKLPSHIPVAPIPPIGAICLLKTGEHVPLVYNGPDGLEDGFGDFKYEDRARGVIETVTLAYDCVMLQEDRLEEIFRTYERRQGLIEEPSEDVEDDEESI